MRIQDLEEAAHEVVRLDRDYAKRAAGEFVIDRMLYSYLCARFENISRQHPVWMYGSAHPHRIDFRAGGTNPVVFELAWRKSPVGAGLSANTNRSELRKLSRVKQEQAKLRALLLLDLSTVPLREDHLRAQYDGINAGPGKFPRKPVRVIYVHNELSFHFPWSPFA
jgi:hypothetical protein